MYGDEYRRSSPRRSAPAVSPFLQRIGVILLAFLVLVPVAKFVARGDGEVVKASGLPGATLSGAPADAASSTTLATLPASLAAAAPTPVATTVAPIEQAAPVTAAPKPVVAAAKPKPLATTAKRKAPATAVAPKVAAKPKPVATTAKPKAAAPTTAKPKPAPTPAPAPAPAPAASYTAAQVESIIREVWPDELENNALAIAKRESRLIPTSRNYCCYGLFAIYYEAGKRLLNSIGVTNANQLLDPWINTRAAYAIYQAAGWDPWKL